MECTIFLSTLLLFTNFKTTFGVCQTGWFGSSCQYKCHCANDQCDVDGKCTGGSTCVRGWFGPLCQYQDLTTVQPGTTTSNTILTDGDDATCAIVQTFNVSWNTLYEVMWLRVVLYEPDFLKNSNVSFTKRDGTNIACLNQTLVRVFDKTTDFFCSTNSLIKEVLIDFRTERPVCSVYISGGRNVALKQPTWQSSNWTENGVTFYSTLAVDGNTSGDFLIDNTCAHALPYVPGSWKVTFIQPVYVNRYVLYNRDDYRYRLKGFSLTSYSSTNNTLFSYTETNPEDNAPVYYVTTTTTSAPVSYVIINIKDILTLCEVEIYGDNFCTHQTFGLEYLNPCNCNDPTETCFVATGGCRSGCAAGYQGEGCVEECDMHHYDENCLYHCSSKCIDSVCESISGKCSSCIRACNATYYGESCKQVCSMNCLDQLCNNINGSCYSCNTGTHGELYDKESNEYYSKGMKDGIGIGIGIGIGTMCGVFIISIAVICLVWRLKRTTHSNGNAKNNYSNQVLELGDGLTSPAFNSENANTKVYDYINESPETTLQEATNEASIASNTYNSLKNEYNDD